MSHEPRHGSTESSSNIGKWMIIGFWILVLAFASFMAQKWMENKARGQIPANFTAPDGRKSVGLELDQWGQYLVQGEINGETVTFVVDTGATHVSITGEVADKLGLEYGAEGYSVTANGTITVNETIIDELSIGQLTLENVHGSINSSMDGEVGLLGMAFLRHFELIQRDGFLTIREP